MNNSQLALQIAKSLGLADQSTNYNYIEDYKGRVVLGENLVDFIAFGMNRQRVDGKDGDDFYVLDTEQLSTLPADSKMVISDDQGVHHFVILTEDESMRITIDPSWMGTSKKTIDIKGREIIVKEGDIASIVVATKEGKILQFSKKQGSTYIDGLKTSDNIVPVLIDKGDKKKIIEEKTSTPIEKIPDDSKLKEIEENRTKLINNNEINLNVKTLEQELAVYENFLVNQKKEYWGNKSYLEKSFLNYYLIVLEKIEKKEIKDSLYKNIIKPQEEAKSALEKNFFGVFFKPSEKFKGLTIQDVNLHKKEIIEFNNAYEAMSRKYQKEISSGFKKEISKIIGEEGKVDANDFTKYKKLIIEKQQVIQKMEDKLVLTFFTFLPIIKKIKSENVIENLDIENALSLIGAINKFSEHQTSISSEYKNLFKKIYNYKGYNELDLITQSDIKKDITEVNALINKFEKFTEDSQKEIAENIYKVLKDEIKESDLEINEQKLKNVLKKETEGVLFKVENRHLFITKKPTQSRLRVLTEVNNKTDELTVFLESMGVKNKIFHGDSKNIDDIIEIFENNEGQTDLESNNVYEKVGDQRYLLSFSRIGETLKIPISTLLEYNSPILINGSDEDDDFLYIFSKPVSLIKGLKGNDTFSCYLPYKGELHGGPGSDQYILSIVMQKNIISEYPIIIDNMDSMNLDKNEIHVHSPYRLSLIEGSNKDLNYFAYESDPKNILFAASKHGIYEIHNKAYMNTEGQTFKYSFKEKKLVEEKDNNKQSFLEIKRPLDKMAMTTKASLYSSQVSLNDTASDLMAISNKTKF